MSRVVGYFRKRILYTTSRGNVNKPDRASEILELRPAFGDFFDAWMYATVKANIDWQDSISIMAILAGSCCENDYIITGKGYADARALKENLELHRIKKYTIEQLRIFIRLLKRFLQYREIIWSA